MWGCFAGETRKTPPHFPLATRNPKDPEFYKLAVRVLIAVGCILAMIFGLAFAYFGYNWAFHGLHIASLTLIFTSVVK